jgi:hypothetical protein
MQFSWWPARHLWKQGGLLGLGFWTKDAERWYLEVVEERHQGTYNLRMAAAWKTYLTGIGQRCLKKRNEFETKAQSILGNTLSVGQFVAQAG